MVHVHAPSLEAEGHRLADVLDAELLSGRAAAAGAFGTERPASQTTVRGRQAAVPGEEPALVLDVRETGLTLRLGDGPEVRADSAALAGRKANAPDPMWRAVLAGEERVVDATAGLGADGFHLASRGAAVTMIERSRVVAALLEDALARARAGDLGADAAAAAGRVRLVVGDARHLLRGQLTHADRPGVVYLDPMFHGPGRRSLPPKGMALFRVLMGEDEDEAADLLVVAREAATRRVVVKRHLKAAPLAGAVPSGAIRGRSVRYDLYAPL